MSYGTTLHIISSCQATASSEIVDRFWASCKQRYIKYPTFTFHVLYDRPSCKFLADAVVTLTTPKTTTLIRRMNTSSSLLMKYQIHATCPEWSSPPPHPQVKHGRHHDESNVSTVTFIIIIIIIIIITDIATTNS